MTAHERSTFDAEAFYAAVDAHRQRLGISWRAVSRQIGLRNMNLGTGLRAGRHVSADVLCRLLAWMGSTDVRPFLRGAPEG